jgi:hypothetical protein
LTIVPLPLLFETLTETVEEAVRPDVLVARAVRVWEELESEEVSREKAQLEVPEAEEKAPLSTCTWTEVKPKLSEAVPERVMEPETVAPFEGEEMETEGGAAVLTVRVAAELVTLPAELLTSTVNLEPESELVVAGVV